jgi:chemotaxis protein methyltransferase CheR
MTELKKIKMTDREFELLKEVINDECGLNYEKNKKYILENRLNTRLFKLNLKSFKEYYDYIKKDYSKKEFEFIVDILTINETYFFRETGQMDVLLKEIIPEFIKQGKKNIKIWSAACSTGEEPFTLAMFLKETGFFNKNINIEIIGTDISNQALNSARAGIYCGFSFRKMVDPYLKKYFVKDDKCYTIKPEIQNLVKFSKFNLLDNKGYFKFKNCDVIFCRNVLIYFNDKLTKQVVDRLTECLTDKGVLFLGHSESLFKYDVNLTLKGFKNGLGYVKKNKEVK